MMKTWAILFVVLMLGNVEFLLAGEVLKLTENDSGKTIELRVRDELEVVLPANPTTGYVWEVSSIDSTVLRLEKSEFMPGDKAIGSGGMEVIKLHAIAKGSSDVRLLFHRPFERNKPPLKLFAFRAIIGK